MLENRPTLYEDLVWVWNAFQTLAASRQGGMGAQPISIADMEAYCRLHGVEDPAQFVRLIQALDQEWLAWNAKSK